MAEKYSYVHRPQSRTITAHNQEENRITKNRNINVMTDQAPTNSNKTNQSNSKEQNIQDSFIRSHF